MTDKRAGNADRDRCVSHLADAVATGHLRPHEFDERRDRALEAVTQSDLRVLVTDLPEMPVPPGRVKRRVVYQVHGARTRFSPWRWGLTLGLGLALAILTGPLMAAAFRGFGHAPGQGVVPILLIFAGILITAIGGVAFAPCETQEE